MKAIITKYHGPGNVRGSRISADDGDGNRIYIPYPHHLSGDAVRRSAAVALCDKMGWTGCLVGGHIRNGMVWVFTDGVTPFVITKETHTKAYCINDGCGVEFDPTLPETRSPTSLKSFAMHYCPKHRQQEDK